MKNYRLPFKLNPCVQTQILINTIQRLMFIEYRDSGYNCVTEDSKNHILEICKNAVEYDHYKSVNSLDEYLTSF